MLLNFQRSLPMLEEMFSTFPVGNPSNLAPSHWCTALVPSVLSSKQTYPAVSIAFSVDTQSPEGGAVEPFGPNKGVVPPCKSIFPSCS